MHLVICVSVVPYSDIAFTGKGKAGNLEVVSYLIVYSWYISDATADLSTQQSQLLYNNTHCASLQYNLNYTKKTGIVIYIIAWPIYSC